MDRATTYSSRPEVIDLISIVFEPEITLLEIQARSIQLYLDHRRISSIIVVVNDSDAVAEKINPSWWGINQSKVRIIPRSKIGVYSFLDGWSSQQLYKLAAANMSTSDWSMCLDSKTWLVNNLQWEELWDDKGRANFKSFKSIDVFQSAKQFSENFFDIEFTNVIGPGGVPFMFHTNTVKDMVSFVEQKTNKNFLDFFAESLLIPIQVTEFIFYSAFVHFKNRYSSLYSDNQYYTITNLADWQMQNFDQILHIMNKPNNLTASIQGRAYPHLSDDQLDSWLQFLLSKQLITEPENTKILLNTLR